MSKSKNIEQQAKSRQEVDLSSGKEAPEQFY